MSRLFRVLRWLGVALAAVGAIVVSIVLYAPYADGPFELLPGGRLRGPEERALPSNLVPWSDIRSVELETNPTDPRSVTVALLISGEQAFVPATLTPAEKRWPKALDANPNVRLRVAGRIYRATVARVVDPDLHQRLAALGSEKYSAGYFDPERTWFFLVGHRD